MPVGFDNRSIFRRSVTTQYNIARNTSIGRKSNNGNDENKIKTSFGIFISEKRVQRPKPTNLVNIRKYTDTIIESNRKLAS